MLLYGVPLSPFVRKTLFVLYEMALPFEQTMTIPGDKSPAFRAVSPMGLIPGFVDGDISLFDSSAICHYLASKYSSALIEYGNPLQLAHLVGWDKYADEVVAPATLPPLFERLVKPLRMSAAPDESAVQQAVEHKLPPVIDYLEARLADSGEPWLTGSRFTYADIAVGAHMSNLALANVDIDVARWPRVAAWFKQVLDRPACQHLCEDARSFKP